MRQRQNRLERSIWTALVARGFILAGPPRAAAQDQKIDVTRLVRDSQQILNESGEFNMVWWLPDEFWKASLAASPTATTPEQREGLIKIVHPYFIIGVIKAKSGSFAAMTYQSEAEVRALLQLKDNAGNVLKPLANDKIDASVPGLLGLMKPMMARMLGPMGENLNFFVFEGLNKDGARRFDPLRDGSLEIDLGEHIFKWRLPLDSLLPKQKCPTCGESLSGTYKFCPYDGTSLAGGK